MLESPVIEAIRQNQDEDPKGVEGWVSVRTDKACKCGTRVGYISVNHIPASWEPGDPDIFRFVSEVGNQVVVEAPSDAMPFHVLTQFYTPHRPGDRQ